MTLKPSTVERAYQLARSGDVIDILHIKMKLNAEGYINVDAHFDGYRLKGELRKLIAATPSNVRSLDGRRVRVV